MSYLHTLWVPFHGIRHFVSIVPLRETVLPIAFRKNAISFGKDAKTPQHLYPVRPVILLRKGGGHWLQSAILPQDAAKISTLL